MPHHQESPPNSDSRENQPVQEIRPLCSKIYFTPVLVELETISDSIYINEKKESGKHFSKNHFEKKGLDLNGL